MRLDIYLNTKEKEVSLKKHGTPGLQPLGGTLQMIQKLLLHLGSQVILTPSDDSVPSVAAAIP